MTLHFFDGFEGGPSNPKPGWSTLLGVNQTVNGVRTGIYGMAGVSGGNKLTIPASAKLFIGFAWKTSNPIANIVVMQVHGDAGATTHLTLNQNTTTGRLELRRGLVAGTVIATSTIDQETLVWRYLTVEVTIHDSTGIFKLDVDGTNVINFVGDTKNAGTSTNIDALSFVNNTASSNYTIDDLWVCDAVDATATQGRPNNTNLGDLRVGLIQATGAGSSTTWTPSTGANWSCTDDPQNNITTDYVTGTTPGDQDLYALADLPSGATTVYGVQAGVYAQKTDAGAKGVKILLRENSTTTPEPASHALSVTYAEYYTAMLVKRPSDNALWTVSDINALQAGTQVESA